MIRAFVEPVLNFLPRGIPNYPDHGMLHSNNLLKLLHNFITNFKQFLFSQEEKLLLAIAVHLHDIGCILGRSRHNKRSVMLLEHARFRFLEELIGNDLVACLKYVIVAHSSDYDMEKVPTKPIHSQIRLRLLCSVFRLLDGCEISSSRVSETLYDILTTYSKLKPENAEYWKVHLSIVGVVFSENKIIVDCDDLRKAKGLTSHLKEDLVHINRVFREEGFPQLDLQVVKLKLM